MRRICGRRFIGRWVFSRAWFREGYTQSEEATVLRSVNEDAGSELLIYTLDERVVSSGGYCAWDIGVVNG